MLSGKRRESGATQVKRLVTVSTLFALALASLPAIASDQQGSDTDSAVCGGSVYGKLYGDGYAQDWQDQNHDGQWWDGGTYSGWQVRTQYWGLHASGTTQYVSVVGGDHAGSPNVSITVRCPDSGITGPS